MVLRFNNRHNPLSLADSSNIDEFKSAMNRYKWFCHINSIIVLSLDKICEAITLTCSAAAGQRDEETHSGRGNFVASLIILLEYAASISHSALLMLVSLKAMLTNIDNYSHFGWTSRTVFGWYDDLLTISVQLHQQLLSSGSSIEAATADMNRLWPLLSHLVGDVPSPEELSDSDSY